MAPPAFDAAVASWAMVILQLLNTGLQPMREQRLPLARRLIASHMAWIGDHSIRPCPCCAPLPPGAGSPVAVVHFDATTIPWALAF
jgi:hypothetical protein